MYLTVSLVPRPSFITSEIIGSHASSFSLVNCSIQYKCTHSPCVARKHTLLVIPKLNTELDLLTSEGVLVLASLTPSQRNKTK